MSVRKGGKVIAGNVSHYNTGDTFLTKRTDTNLAGAVECDGATYNTTDFTGTGSIGELLEAGKLDYISLSAYSTAISTKGWCDKIGWDGAGNTAFRVPTLNAHIVQTNNIPVKPASSEYNTTDWNQMKIKTIHNEHLSGSANIGVDATGGLANLTGSVTTGSAKLTPSNLQADTTDTAQLRVMIQIANGATDQALETCTGVLADVATLKGYDYVVEFQAPTAENNHTWYRKYKSGWVEQGGNATLPQQGANTVAGAMLNLPVAMQNSNYSVVGNRIIDGGSSSELTELAVNFTTTSCEMLFYSTVATIGPSVVNMVICGMAAQ